MPKILRGEMIVKKKQILASLVMLSLLQGSAYAKNVNSHTYIAPSDIEWPYLLQETWHPNGDYYDDYSQGHILDGEDKLIIENNAIVTFDFEKYSGLIFSAGNDGMIVRSVCYDYDSKTQIGGDVIVEGEGTVYGYGGGIAIGNYYDPLSSNIKIEDTNFIIENFKTVLAYAMGGKISFLNNGEVSTKDTPVGIATELNGKVELDNVKKFSMINGEEGVEAVDESEVELKNINEISLTNVNTGFYATDQAKVSVNSSQVSAVTETFALAESNAVISLNANDYANINGSLIADAVAASENNEQKAKIDFRIGIDSNTINSTRDNSLIFKGEALSANNATINVNLGSGSRWEGRADDFKDADLAEWREAHGNEFNEMFETLNSSGNVNITMQDDSYWNVTGQSWVSSLDGSGIVDLRGDETKGYAVHIGTLSGNNTFVLNLTPEALETSDMIYVQNGTNDKQTLLVANERELVDNKDWDEIRFATVADADGSVGDSNFDYGGSFGDTYTIKGRGVRNVDYEIKYVAMNEDTTSDDDNKKYNGGESFDEVKPGEDYVQDNYNKIDEGQNSQYIYLVRNENDTPVVNPDEDLTDSGKTVINMSRANYKNAIYMDRLNKRLGEARYINNEEEQGMWVRIRHDRIGKTDAYRSQNTMYELGYDKKQECDNGMRRVGFAVDYMHGDTGYSDIAGKGEIDRYGLWLYDTWLGDKGHYADYVAKWGHLSNDFDIRDKDSFEHVTGDYSNNVFSISAEYGRKKDIGNDWYIEPQAQLQLARVTAADYVTSQNTRVSVEGINSLIGRAGFRLGRDVDERSTVYVKADLLHEFLGDQTITATDVTGTLREEYENKGTWYDVGFGFATALSNNSYAFMDFEKSFGNDNDETYQINAGVQWTF